MKTDKHKAKPAFNPIEKFVFRVVMKEIFGVETVKEKPFGHQAETIDIPYEEIKEPKQIPQ